MAFRVLNVSEKNASGKEIARVMSRGRNSRREGMSRYNKIYDYEYNLFGRRCEMTMTSVSGHLMFLDFPEAYRKWHSCEPLALFTAPVEKKVSANMDDIRKTLEREVRGCNILIIWTDCDREGENIGYEVIEVCRRIKPRIDIYRARFSEITAASITRACATLGRPDQRTSSAVDARVEFDLRIGAAFTRYQTLRLQKSFPQVLSGEVVSFGSCQLPTLGFVVQRYKEVAAFVAETFFKIKVKHSAPDGEAEFNWERVQLSERVDCAELHQKCLENPRATVVNHTTRRTSKCRPLPLDTVELEKLASRKLRINAKETMRIAEKLYNQGFISYPRTETNIFPPSLDLDSLIQLQTVDENWGQFATNLLAEGANPRQGSKTDKAHPPIHPTKYTGALHGDEKRLYEFIVRSFLACCSKDAQGVETTVEIDIARERFTAKGLAITAKNYLDVYPYEKWCDKTLPIYRTGDTFMPTSIDMIEGETEPPSLLTEADLITLMVEHGIGTDATHAEHIEKIKARNYVGVQADGKFVPGELGMGLVQGYDAMGLEMSQPHLRAELENDLKNICLGRKQKDVVLREHIERYKEMFVQTCEQVNELDKALVQFFGEPVKLTEDRATSQVINTQPVFACPSCQSQMCIKKIETSHYNGFVIGCMRYPECTSRAFLPTFVLDAQVSKTACSRCAPRLVYEIKFQFKRGSVPPIMEIEDSICILCDESLREVLNFRIKSSISSSVTRRNTGRMSSTVQSQPRGSQRPSFQADNPLNRKRTYHAANQNEVLCRCRQRAVTRTVKKDSPNKGRLFFCCSKPPAQSCRFFEWLDSERPTSQPPASSGQNQRPNKKR